MMKTTRVFKFILLEGAKMSNTDWMMDTHTHTHRKRERHTHTYTDANVFHADSLSSLAQMARSVSGPSDCPN